MCWAEREQQWKSPITRGGSRSEWGISGARQGPTAGLAALCGVTGAAPAQTLGEQSQDFCKIITTRVMGACGVDFTAVKKNRGSAEFLSELIVPEQTHDCSWRCGVWTMGVPMAAAAAAGPNLSFISYRSVKLGLNDLGLRVMWATSVWWHTRDSWAGPELCPSLQPCPLAPSHHQAEHSEPLQLSPHPQGFLWEKLIPHSALNIPQQCLQSVPPQDAELGLCHSVSAHQRNDFIHHLPSQASSPHACDRVLL